MTRVSGISGGVPPARRTARASRGFGLPAEEGAGREAAPACAAEGVAALLGLQERGAPVEPPDSHAARRGHAALDELRGLQLDLLRGAPDAARLAKLADLGRGAEAADPALREVLEGISLRARIELARHRARSASAV